MRIWVFSFFFLLVFSSCAELEISFEFWLALVESTMQISARKVKQIFGRNNRGQMFDVKEWIA